jgi:hypothetical protein
VIRKAVLVLALLGSRPALAVDPYEIQVYVGDINLPRQAGLEVHTNLVGERVSAEGEPRARTAAHLTLEPSFALLEWWELGAYLQFAMLDSGHFAGFKLRSKFVVPARLTGPFILGVNFEVGRGTSALATAGWGSEVRPIVAYARGRWAAAINPIFGWELSAPGRATPELEPCAKVMFDTHHRLGVGLEYYTGLGFVSEVPAWRGQQHLLFAAADLLDGPIELNLGVGRGLTAASDGWTMKLIVGKVF